MLLELNNQTLKIVGASRRTIRLLDRKTSYLVQGHTHVQAFKKKRWDGREHLLTFSRKTGYSVPCGLVHDVIQALDAADISYEFVDKTRVRSKPKKMVWGPVVLRDYQKEAVSEAMAAHNRGRCILKMPIRSGKTKTAARLIFKYGLPTLFVVPSKYLLGQAIGALKECLPVERIGQIGDGQNVVERITVATIQTLQRMAKMKRKEFRELCKRFDVMICDECHHFSGNGTWHNVLKRIDAAYHFGFTATLFPKRKQEQEMGVIWVRALLGRIAVNIPRSRLEDSGHLMKQNVWVHRMQEPSGMEHDRWSHTLVQDCIFSNPWRNKKIAQYANVLAAKKHSVLVISRRVEQLMQVAEQLDKMDAAYYVVTGKEGSDERESIMNAFAKGKRCIVLGSVLSEGADIPHLEVVINGEGGARPVSAVQRQRNLTVSDGKKLSLFIDFYDEMNPYFKRHSDARLSQYEADGASIKFI